MSPAALRDLFGETARSLVGHRSRDASRTRATPQPATLRSAFVGALAAVVIAACSAAGPGPTAAPGSSATTAPASLAARLPTPTPAPTEPFTIHTGQLAAGTYLQSGFTPPLAFTIGTGWRAYFDDPGDLYFEDAQMNALGASRLENIVDPTTGAAVAAPEDLGAWFKQHPALEGVTVTPATVAGLPAMLVEGRATRTKDVYAYPGGNFRLVSGAKYRIYVIPMDGPNLVITTLGPSPAVFDAAASKIQAIIDSLRIAG